MLILITLALMSVYLFVPFVLISIIQLNTGRVNRITKAVNRTALALVAFCINRALSIFWGGAVFLFTELLILLLLIVIVSNFYMNFNIFSRKLNFYTYGIEQLAQELKKWIMILFKQ